MRHGMLLNAMIRYGRKGEVTGLSLRYDVDYVVVVVLVIFDVDRRSVSCDAHAIVWCFAHFYIFRFVQNDILQFSKAKRRLLGNELLLRFCSVAGAS